jgi:hypothetical protein
VPRLYVSVSDLKLIIGSLYIIVKLKIESIPKTHHCANGITAINIVEYQTNNLANLKKNVANLKFFHFFTDLCTKKRTNLCEILVCAFVMMVARFS